MERAYYSNSISGFLAEDDQKILGKLTQYHHFALEDLQKNAWIKQIKDSQGVYPRPIKGIYLL